MLLLLFILDLSLVNKVYNTLEAFIELVWVVGCRWWVVGGGWWGVSGGRVLRRVIFMSTSAIVEVDALLGLSLGCDNIFIIIYLILMTLLMIFTKD